MDDEDREVIKENTGIELKPKSRLKRNAEKVDRHDDEDDKALVKKEIEVRERQQAAADTMQIDTKRRKQAAAASYKAEMRREFEEPADRMLDR